MQLILQQADKEGLLPLFVIYIGQFDIKTRTFRVVVFFQQNGIVQPIMQEVYA